MRGRVPRSRRRGRTARRCRRRSSRPRPRTFASRSSCPSRRPASGPHWLLRVEKRAANTRWVAAELARSPGVPVGDVGYAGLKDRHAVTVQWFSVPDRAHDRRILERACTPPNSGCSRCTPIRAS